MPSDRRARRIFGHDHFNQLLLLSIGKLCDPSPQRNEILRDRSTLCGFPRSEVVFPSILNDTPLGDESLEFEWKGKEPNFLSSWASSSSLRKSAL